MFCMKTARKWLSRGERRTQERDEVEGRLERPRGKSGCAGLGHLGELDSGKECVGGERSVTAARSMAAVPWLSNHDGMPRLPSLRPGVLFVRRRGERTSN